MVQPCSGSNQPTTTDRPRLGSSRIARAKLALTSLNRHTTLRYKPIVRRRARDASTALLPQEMEGAQAWPWGQARHIIDTSKEEKKDAKSSYLCSPAGGRRREPCYGSGNIYATANNGQNGKYTYTTPTAPDPAYIFDIRAKGGTGTSTATIPAR
jgi:hypothetical protein